MCWYFYTLQPWHDCDIIVIIQKPHIIGTSPHDAPVISYILLVGKSVHAPGDLSRGSHFEQNIKVKALIGPHFKEGNGGSRCTMWHIYKIVNCHLSDSLLLLMNLSNIPSVTFLSFNNVLQWCHLYWKNLGFSWMQSVIVTVLYLCQSDLVFIKSCFFFGSERCKAWLTAVTHTFIVS